MEMSLNWIILHVTFIYLYIFFSSIPTELQINLIENSCENETTMDIRAQTTKLLAATNGTINPGRRVIK